MNKLFFIVVGTILLISFTSASFGFDNTDIPSLRDATSASASSSNFTNLSQLDDTSITTPANGEVLTWSSAVMQWVNSAVGSASKWIFGSSPYWYNDSDTVYFNETKLNDTIDARASAGGNLSWNQTFATTLYSDIKWGYNMSDGSYNATYDAHIDGNASWNQTFADTLYAPNTTAGIQALINSTGIYSTYNLSYVGSLNNGSYLSTYNATYFGSVNNASYLSTYNATYDANIGGSSPWVSTADYIYNTTASVGIGTSAPANIFEIQKTLGVGEEVKMAIGMDTDDLAWNEAGVIGYNNTNVVGTRYLYLGLSKPENNKELIISANGIGIGTASPSQKLEIQKDQNAETAILIQNDNDDTASKSCLELDAGAEEGDLCLFSASYTTSNQYVAQSLLLESNNLASGGLGLSTLGNKPINLWTNGVRRMTILGTNGKVGIGTVSPDADLHINGTSTNVMIEGTTSDTWLTIKRSATNMWSLGIDNSGGDLHLSHSAGLGTNDVLIVDKDTYAFNFNNTLYTDGSGNVGIGTASPSSELHIVGDANISNDLIVGRSLLLDGEGYTIAANLVMDSYAWIKDNGGIYFGDSLDSTMGWDDVNSRLAITSDVAVVGDVIGNTCPYAKEGMITTEDGAMVSNAGMALGNGQAYQGAPQPCAGVVTSITGTCPTCSSGVNEVAMELRVNGAAQTCDTAQLTSAYDTDVTACAVSFSALDRLNCYSKTETGATNGLCTLTIQYN